MLSSGKGSSPRRVLDSLSTSKPARWQWQRPVQRRTTVLALLSLLALCAYVLLLSQPSLSLAALPLARDPSTAGGPPPTTDAWRLAAHKKLDWKKLAALHQAASARPDLVLDAPHELAALSSFLAALPENHIPAGVDPAAPLDPSLVLDFDTRGDNAREELEEVVHDVWTRNPVILYGKLHSSVSREIKAMLSDMYLKPAPTIFDVDMRADAPVLEPLLLRLTGASSLPVLIVGGHPITDLDVVRKLNADGTLKKMVSTAGAKIDGARRKKGGRRA
ncbi:hypothetical protein PUNSTDRAFT_62402 [Punctularia strigosozonata HHB-11173 SS5]|uniref:uncharacterized protein n=1 Tax=Punctularia strigosozonata (strain HHB-11173) TaxID=741275 RepID=UPI00044172BF|nr:uncharacterized protein PUNSTDRAFT_62402 [Punctularia strigosozonata HHB-11173 SS5]EIN11902.1 hypothetical protein PUNSTDRAFT_62402 [Punctularia strigosozonata HHB-11173 SS5]